jgi:tetratricopeptide (TPR) repeat protein
LGFRLISLFVLVFFLLANGTRSYAQTSKKSSADSVRAARAHTDSVNKAKKREAEAKIKARKQALDSIKVARERKMDSAATARKHRTDSIGQARHHFTDSVAKVRKHRSDSIASIRKHKESRKYRDSVAKAKAAKTKELQDRRKERTDSIRLARKEYSDSVTAVRTERTDSIKTVQKRRTDSLATVRKYRSSKRYSDSVTLVRRQRSDSIKSVQKDFRDSLAAIRKHVLDSTKLVRAHILDSTKMARTRHTDSLKMVRKAKTDSLLKKKEHKAKVAKANEKKKIESLKLKLDLKQKKEREAWSNKSMLKKGWGPKRRLTQNSFTHYNYYFNANRKMEEAELNMRRVNRENYDSLIGIFPFDPNKDSSLLAADMDSIIHKVSVGIQIHDPRVKWSNDMYLMLGEAYYYKGSYENASIAFRYIISSDQNSKSKKGKKNSYSYHSKSTPSIVEKKKKSKLAFLQHKSVHNDAILWLARTYTTSGQIENAESILSLLEYDENLPDNLIGRLAVEKAFAYRKAGNNLEAAKQLSIAQEDDNLPDWLLQRISFLNGQLHMDAGEYTEAAESFEKVLTFFPKIEMDFYTRKYIAYNKLMAGQEVANAMTPLKKMLKDTKYSGYYDQVYFVLGKLSAKAGKNDEAIEYFKKSTTTPKASKKQKAQSFASLGDVYYGTGSYGNAKNAYDSAAKYSTSASKDKAVAAAVQRSSGLKEVSGPADIIKEQDSLLDLASLSKKEQQATVRRYLRDLKKKRDDSIFNAENAVTVSLPTSEPENDKGGSSSWYFSNPALMSQGSADFKRKWGNRALTDNWRRSAGQPLAGGSKSGEGGADESEESDIETTDDGLPTEESLLAKIPNTPQQKELAYKTEQKAYILLAKAYVDQLEDYNAAINTLDTLDKRFPVHTQKEEELYLRYRIALKQGNYDKAQGYSNELVSKFPQSQYIKILRPKQSESKPTNDNATEVAAYFDETYDLLMKHQYTEVLMRTEAAGKKYNHPVYKKRFQITEAMAYAGSGNYDKSDTITSMFIKTNPADSLTDWARSVSKYVADMRSGGKPSWYKEGTYPPVAEKKDTKPAAPAAPATPPPPPPPPVPDAPAMYAYHADSVHYCIVVLPGLDSRTVGLKNAIRSFDSAKYTSGSFELLIDMYNMSQCVLTVKSFINAAEAKSYMNELIKSQVLSDYKTEETSIYVISAWNYKKMFADKTTDGYRPFYSVYYTQ